MNIYKISATRAVSTHANYFTDVYTGSSFNKTRPKKIEIPEEKAGCTINEFNVYEEIGDYDNRTNKINPRSNVNDLPGGFGLSPAAGSASKPRSLSNRSKDKVKNKIQSLYRCSLGSNFTFLTLTFVAKVTDQDGKKCLNKFLTVARKKFGTFLYIWIAERQSDTKNIHFHLITNRRFEIKYFNSLWVLQQYNAGIQHKDYDKAEIDQRFLNQSMGQILNPFDIKKINSVDSLAIYLTMYVTKCSDTFDCACWHCCRNVSKLFTSALISENTFIETQNPEINFNVNIKTGEVFECSTYVSDYALIVNIHNTKHFKKYLSEVDLLNSWIIGGMKKIKVPQIDFLDYSQIYNNKKSRTTIISKDINKLPADLPVYSSLHSPVLHNIISHLRLSAN